MESSQYNNNEQYMEETILPPYDKKPPLYYAAPAIYNLGGAVCFFSFFVVLGTFQSGNILGGFIALAIFVLSGLISIYCWVKRNNLEGKKQCPSCKDLVPREIRFCTGCGLDLIPHCASCDAIAQPFDRFCPSCGSELPPSSISAAIPSSSTPITPTPNSIPLTKTLTAPSHPLRCPSCQATIQHGEAFCGSCGYNLEQTIIK